MKNPSAILTADWHIQQDTPSCRIDDYMAAQESKIRQVMELSARESIPVIIAGDLGERAYWTNPLLTWFMGILADYGEKPALMATVLGQHDLPYHQPGKYGECGVRVLEQAEFLSVLGKPGAGPHVTPWAYFYGAWWEQPVPKPDKGPAVLVMHRMVIDSPLWPGQQAPQARTILRKHPGYRLIVTGDNHKTFVAEMDGRLLVNPGSLMRRTAAQIDHRPCVFLWRAEDNELEQVFLDVNPGAVTRDHMPEVTEDPDARMEAFVERFGASREVGLSFQDNLQAFFDKNDVSQAVQDKVWKAVG